MKEKIETKSKYYISPGFGRSVFHIILNVAVLIVMLTGIVKIFTDGFHIRILGEICLALLIVSLFSGKNKSYYMDVYAELYAETDHILMVSYKHVPVGKHRSDDVDIMIDAAEIKQVEFSDKLSALRFLGKIKKRTNKKGIEVLPEWIFYVEEAAVNGIDKLLKENYNLNIKYIDRQG